MVVGDKNFFMRLAVEEAWKYQGLTYPNPAVGSTIVSHEGVLLAVEAHHKAGEPHAEVNALKAAYYKLTQDTTILALKKSSEIHAYLIQNHNNIFKNSTLYTTLEPCSHQGKTPSCASLISQLGIKKVYVGLLDKNPLAKGGNKILEQSGCDIEIELLRDECENLMQPFKLWQERNFVFFKWAQRLNGTTDQGDVSSIESRKHVHALRDVCDLLVIGGNTVRQDRPTLDARLVSGKAPDILILSQEKEFDQSIPLFSIKNRKVFISNTLEKIEDYKCVMIEGSQKMFELTAEVVDYYLCYLAPSFGGVQGFTKIRDNFEILNLQKESEDIIVWMKREEGKR